MNGVELDFDLTTIPWVVGPTPARPPEAWLPEMIELMVRTFELHRRRDRRKVDYVTEVLTRIARGTDATLPFLIFRWVELSELPLVATFGMAERESAEVLQDFLDAVDMAPVEPAVHEDVAAPEGTRVQRATAYSQPDGALFTELRYVVDSGHPDAVALVSTGTRDPGALVAATEELDTFAASMRVVAHPS